MEAKGTPRKKTPLERIPVVTVSYNAPDLVREVVSSFRRFYPNPYYVIDGSDPRQLAEIREIVAMFENVELIPFGYNIHHGPGMAWAIANLPLSGPVLFLDSDVSVVKPGFLETLVEALGPDMYGVGNVQVVDAGGHNVPPGPGVIPYLHPACMLCNIDLMRNWPLPTLHGAPMIQPMTAIRDAGRGDLLGDVAWVANDFAPGTERIYLAHDWQGTVARTGGYHLEARAEPVAVQAPPPVPAGAEQDLLQFIPPGAGRLILAGCVSPALAAACKRLNPAVDLLRLDAPGSAPAEGPWDAVAQIDLETADDAFFASQGDRSCWVFESGLERMRDPWAVLARIRKALPPGGLVVACLPNAQHWLLQAKLAIGDFRYQKDGQLDRAHLRWFTRATLFELFQGAGFRVTGGYPRIYDEPGRRPVLPVVRWMAEAVGADPDLAVQDSMALQYVVRAEAG